MVRFRPRPPTPTPGPGLQSQFAILWAQPYDLMYNVNAHDTYNAVPRSSVLPPGMNANVAHTV